jgi:acetoin utilization deacetylase AcuC-like enzyme
MIIVHSPHCLEYNSPGHPERSDRVVTTVSLLRQNPSHRWIDPQPCTEEDLLRVHDADHVESVRAGTYLDSDTPHHANIDALARLSAGGAVTAAREAIRADRAFSLMRPPGHHAKRHGVMGFCYFNNIAVAVAHMLHHDPHLHRVAILDFDCHHGNGTENIFFGDERILFCSLHQSPCYPGTGSVSRKNCLNYPLPPGTGPSEFLRALDQALDRIAGFKPDLLAISAGFDAYHLDPITHMGLEIETYGAIGKRIARVTGWAHATGTIPSFAVLEGGYSDDLAQCVEAFVNGWDGC